MPFPPHYEPPAWWGFFLIAAVLGGVAWLIVSALR